MQKFSISTLLWIVSICAAVVAVVIMQRSLEKSEAELAAAKSEVAKFRDEIGRIVAGEPGKYQIRHFKDRYTSDTEFRWRIHVPDASSCNIFYATGVLPPNGVPQKRQALIGRRLPVAPADLVLIVENRENRNAPSDFRIGFYPEFEGNPSQPIQSQKMSSVDWMPWFRNEPCIYENPPFDSQTAFGLDEPFIIMKHYTVDKDGEMIGYMFWLEQTRPSVLPK